MVPERRLALITGASRRQGIGAAICRRLAAEGSNVAFTHWRPFDREAPWPGDEEGPDALADELRALGAACQAVEVDLADPEAPGQLLDEVTAGLGLPDVLVNNAAHSLRDGYRALDADTLDAHYAVNLRGTALLCVELARRRADRGGRIVNLTSGQSLGPMPGELAYVASKGAVEAFTVTLAAELAPQGFSVNALDPGPTDTGWMTSEERALTAAGFPGGRINQPEDVARVAAFLLSDDAALITGQVIHASHGFRT